MQSTRRATVVRAMTVGMIITSKEGPGGSSVVIGVIGVIGTAGGLSVVIDAAGALSPPSSLRVLISVIKPKKKKKKKERHVSALAKS